MDLYHQTVGDEAHDAGRLHPGDLLQLRFTLGQRHKEDISSQVAAHYFHDLRASYVVSSRNFNVVAGINAESPGMLAIAIECPACDDEYAEHKQCQHHPLQSVGCFFREGTATDRDALLSSQEGRFLFHIQVN